jgi:hypothetical protein
MAGASRLGDEIAIAKMKKYKSPGSEQIPAELIQEGGFTAIVMNRSHQSDYTNKTGETVH